MDPLAIAVVAAGWVMLGLFVGLWMVRRGHDPRWVVIAVALGPIFVPVAVERVERRLRLATVGPGAQSIRQDDAGQGPRVLVGMDGSPESQQALSRVLGLLGPHCGLLMLAEVVPYDATEGDDQATVEEATERLALAADTISDAGTKVEFEVLVGPPGPALRQFAEDQGMDLLVTGRRGRGLSPRLLGSVSSDLVRHSRTPVLVVEPPRSVSSSATSAEGSTRHG